MAEEYPASQEGRRLPTPHCIAGRGKGWNLAPRLDKLVDPCLSLVVPKGQFGTHPVRMEETCNRLGVSNGDEIEVCGVCSDVCVIANVVILKTLYPESPITVDSRAVAGTTTEANEAALTVMRSLQVDVI